MKQKEYEHCYKARYKRPCTIGTWLSLFKAWRYESQLKFGIVKHRHRRSIAKRDRCRLIIDYYEEHKYRKPHRVTIISKPTWEWYLTVRRKTQNEIS